MATIDERVQVLRDEVANLKVDIALIQADLRSLTSRYDRHETLQDTSRQQVPNTLLGIIAAAIGIAGVLIQIFIARGP